MEKIEFFHFDQSEALKIIITHKVNYLLQPNNIINYSIMGCQTMI